VSRAAYRKRTDPELVEMCLLGDVLAWETLLRRYKRFIYSIPIKFGFSNSDSSDVFQFTCLKLLEHLPEVKDDRKIGKWLATTASRQCLAIRLLQQQDSAGADQEVEEPLDPAGTLEEIHLLAEKHQTLREAVEDLPERCRQMIEMLYLDKSQPTYVEIAERLNIPVPSIGPNRARCLDKLRMIVRQRGIKGVNE